MKITNYSIFDVFKNVSGNGNICFIEIFKNVFIFDNNFDNILCLIIILEKTVPPQSIAIKIWDTRSLLRIAYG